MDVAPVARPLFVMVGGAPASGKTTLARHLAIALELPLLSRDPITEALAEAFRPDSREAMERLIPASFGVFYRLMAHFLGLGTGLVAETNFHRGISEANLEPFLKESAGVHIFCSIPRSLSHQRFTERLNAGQRHWGFFDEDRVARLHAGEHLNAWDLAQPLDLDVPTLTVDTVQGYAPALSEILAYIGSAHGQGRHVFS